MVDDAISEDVKRFISAYIDSVELLEVLLLIRRAGKKEWSADSISRELRSNPSSVTKRLTDLRARGLVSVKEGSPPLYYYHPETEALDSAIQGLAEAYAERQARVIDLIFSKPINTLRDFSDAFKLKREDKNG
ncbi:MAG: hypothetical protein EPO39_19645 [Candidatus Manganitrophaceae bacterium]|nr:MAG: hypothetical protein EPO39_19645 [Candidatus Manganitrophaceae bacterium]